MRQYLDLGVWVFLFALLPVTVLILLSQNTLPGDFFYPVKRGMENIVLVASAVSPSTKAAFRTDLTQRRFGEAQELLVSKADTSAYNDFVVEVLDAKKEISKLSDPKEKAQKTKVLLSKIDEYQAQLTQVQNQIRQVETYQNPPASSQTLQPAQTPEPSSSSSPAPTPVSVPSQAPSPTQTPVPQETAQVQQTPVPPAPPLAPSVISVIVNDPQKGNDLGNKLGTINNEIAQIGDELRTQNLGKNKENSHKESGKNDSEQKNKSSGENRERDNVRPENNH